MATLTYTFDDDTTSQPPAGWDLWYESNPACSALVVDDGGSKSVVFGTPNGELNYYINENALSLGDAVFHGAFLRASASSALALRLRVSGSFGSETYYGFDFGNNSASIYKFVGGSYTLLTSGAATITAGTIYGFKVESTGTTHRLKVWAWAGAEPGAWNLSTSDADISTGNVIIGAIANSVKVYHAIIESDDITIDVDVTQDPVGAITITGYNPTVVATQPDIVATPVGSIVITGYNPTVTASAAATRLFFKFKDEAGNVWTREIDRTTPVREVVYNPLIDPPDPFNFIGSTPDIVLADATEGDFNLGLVTAVGREGFIYTVKKIDSTAYTVTLVPALSEEIEGESSLVISAPGECVSFVSDNADWHVLNRMRVGLLYDTPSAVTLNTGTGTAGDVDSFATALDGDTYDVDEVTGTPGFDIELDFTGVSSFDELRIRMAYNGTSAHIVHLLLYNYDTTSYDTVAQLLGTDGEFVWSVVPVPNSTSYISSGAVNAKIYHTTAGNASHDVSIDYVALVSRMTV